MPNYRLVTYESEQGPRPAVVADGQVFGFDELGAGSPYRTMPDVLDDWDRAHALIENRTTARIAGKPLKSVKLLAPVLYPSSIYCAGANYVDHVQEMARVQNLELEADPRSRGLKPWHFIKAARSIVESGARIELPGYSKMVDWEVELAVVIGRKAKNVEGSRALDYVAGYTIANDLSARDFTARPQMAATSPFRYDWVSQKCFDAACPIGPWIVPASEIPDPQQLGIRLWVNDVIKQDSHTSKMIFTVADQIEFLSTRMTLYPGDIILTGTPAGVGLARNEFIRPGDTVRLWIERIGTLINTFV
ncbi:MAG: fumarylacetoacetate hydrolase family protein [Candidatus Binataceae bacterium]|nr:fumarylacetoacetate hydrolase family protein [Candidatus Binataceae bacterium]